MQNRRGHSSSDVKCITGNQHVLTTGLLHGDGCFFRCFQLYFKSGVKPLSVRRGERIPFCMVVAVRNDAVWQSHVFFLCGYFDTNSKSNEEVNNYA